MTTRQTTDRRPYYWERFTGPDQQWRRDEKTGSELRPPGEDLAAMRTGLGRAPMDSPKLWPYYTSKVDDELAKRGQVSATLAAEHATLALYGLHQQSQPALMHRPDVTLGQALRALRQSERFSVDVLDTRVAALASASSVTALLVHLRGLITQLRTDGQPLDYTLLMDDIRAWHYIDRRSRIRRSWALGYQVWNDDSRPRKR